MIAIKKAAGIPAAFAVADLALQIKLREDRFSGRGLIGGRFGIGFVPHRQHGNIVKLVGISDEVRNLGQTRSSTSTEEVTG